MGYRSCNVMDFGRLFGIKRFTVYFDDESGIRSHIDTDDPEDAIDIMKKWLDGAGKEGEIEKDQA